MTPFRRLAALALALAFSRTAFPQVALSPQIADFSLDAPAQTQSFRLSNQGKLPMHVVVSVQNWTMDIDGRVSATPATEQSLAVTRGGSVRLRNINGKRLAVTVAGLGGSVRGGGAVDRLAVVLRTFGNVQLKALTARDVHAVLGGSGQIVVTATQKVDAILSGSGAIVYYGNPAHVHKTVLGTGSVTAG